MPSECNKILLSFFVTLFEIEVRLFNRSYTLEFFLLISYAIPVLYDNIGMGDGFPKFCLVEELRRLRVLMMSYVTDNIVTIGPKYTHVIS